MTIPNLNPFRAIAIASFLVMPGITATAQSGYFTEAPLFHPHPKPGDKNAWNVKNFGPVGIGIDLKAPGFTMEIKNVEEGSPAAKTGKLKPGQVIESINGTVLKEIDPRIILGDIITEAEATDGKINVKIKGQGTVTVSIPVMGRYSETWPVNCPKSDKIVRGMADVLAKRDKASMGGIIFLLSTGEDKDLAVVRRWMKKLDSIGSINWHRGFMGPGVCEYYLRTGDASVLPLIREAVKELEKNMFNGSWGGRGGPASFTYSTGTGALHAAGVHCMTFLLMAKSCGVEVDEYTLQESLKQFYRFAGHGNVAYGEGFPEGGYTDNGKHSGLALAMQAATLLTPEGESSVYAKARDNSAMKAFYATNWFHAAHTGGGLGEIWHHAGISLMRENRPVQYRSYLDTRRWVMELSRRHDGSIGIGGMTDRYDASVTDRNKEGIDFGTFFALTYTLPRKQLQLFGAPRSKWAKSYQLPERPWGNATDDIFLSNDYVKNPTFGEKDLLAEKVPTDSSFPVFQRTDAPGSSDEVLMQYLHHPEFGLREGAMRILAAHGRAEVVIPLLKSDDARLRHIGTLAIAGMFKGNPLPVESVTPEMWDLLGKLIEDPDESWWVVQAALDALSRADAEIIAKHKDRIFDLLENRPCTWTQTNALVALAKVSTHPSHYKTTLARTLDASTKVWTNSASYRFNRMLREHLASAPADVKKFAAPLLEETYADIPVKKVFKGGATQGGEATRQRIAEVLATLPGGSKFINTLPKKTLAYVRSGEPRDMFEYKKFNPDPRFTGRWKYISKCYSFPPEKKEVMARMNEYSKKEAAAKANPKTGRGAFRPRYLVLDATSPPKRGSAFWSETYVIDNRNAAALGMSVHKIDGKEFLLLEAGLPEPIKPAFKPAHELYIKE
jgi:hypothetical protein